VGQFGKEHVFKDVDSIPLGSDFRQILTERVAASDVFLTVIGDAWLSIIGKNGIRRIDDPGDFVRIEIEAALSCKIPVIPVLVGSSSVPQAEQLPRSLRELSFRNGLPVRPDPDFHNDMDRLIRGIESAVLGSAQRRPWRVKLAGVAAALVVLGVLMTAMIAYVAANKRIARMEDNEPKGAAGKDVGSPDLAAGSAGDKGADTGRSPKAEPSVLAADTSSSLKKPASPTVVGTTSTEGEFHRLFNGKDLSGWKVGGNPNHTWKVVDGILEGSGGPPPPSSLATERTDFANFHLRVETKLAEGSGTGISFRITEGNGGVAWYAASIAGTDQGDENTGSLRYHAHKLGGPGAIALTLAKANPVLPIRPDQWFTQEVIADGNLITVMVRGIEVSKFKVLDRQLMSGPIRISCRRNCKVEFRKIEIRELKRTAASGSPEGVEARKGPELVDWPRLATITGSDNWQIVGNELVQNSHTELTNLHFGDQTWTDYSFSVDVKLLQKTSEVGLVFRELENGAGYWYGAGTDGSSPEQGSVCRWLPAANPPFVVLPTRRSQDVVLTPGQWHTMRIDVRGGKFTAYFDGHLAFSASDPSITRGAVGLRVRDACRFRKVRVTGPNGQVLWQGLPELLTANSFGVPVRKAN
jgi:hypothetical protein